MDSIFETQRQTHEEIERYEHALAEVLLQAPTVVCLLSPLLQGRVLTEQHRNITRRDRKAAEILDRIVALRESLVRQYEDEPGYVCWNPSRRIARSNFLLIASLRPVELAALTAPPGAKGQGDDLDEFYARFEKIKDFHRQHRNINSRAFINELEELVKGDGMETVYVDDEQEPIIVDSQLISDPTADRTLTL
jgi:splicing factor 3A subunit 3